MELIGRIKAAFERIGGDVFLAAGPAEVFSGLIGKFVKAFGAVKFISILFLIISGINYKLKIPVFIYFFTCFFAVVVNSQAEFLASEKKTNGHSGPNAGVKCFAKDIPGNLSENRSIHKNLSSSVVNLQNKISRKDNNSIENFLAGLCIGMLFMMVYLRSLDWYNESRKQKKEDENE